MVAFRPKIRIMIRVLAMPSQCQAGERNYGSRQLQDYAIRRGSTERAPLEKKPNQQTASDVRAVG